MRPSALPELLFHALFRLNVPGLPRSVRESSPDEWQEELVNSSQAETPKLSFDSLSHSLELEMNAPAIMHTFERSINVMLKRFDWINEPPLCFCARNFVTQLARSTPVLEYKPSGGDTDSYFWMLPRSLQQIYVPLFIPFSFKDKMRRMSFPNSLHALHPNFSWSWWVILMGHWIVSSTLYSWMVRCDFRQTIAVRAVVSISSLAVSNWNGKE